MHTERLWPIPQLRQESCGSLVCSQSQHSESTPIILNFVFVNSPPLK